MGSPAAVPTPSRQANKIIFGIMKLFCCQWASYYIHNSNIPDFIIISIKLYPEVKGPCVGTHNGIADIIQIFDKNLSKTMLREEQIKTENKELRHLIEGYMTEIQKLKQSNEQHENQIDTLLKFNERLLTIIETELNQYNSKKSDRSFSLQPISEITERDSDIAEVVNPIKASIMKSRNNQNSQQRGEQQRENLMLGSNKQELHSIEASPSDYNSDYSGRSDKMKEVLVLISEYRKEYGNSVQEYENMRKKMKNDLQTGNKQFHTISDQNKTFYTEKKSQIQTLKQKVHSYVPEAQLEKIIKTNQYSSETQNKLMKIMNQFK